MKKKRRPIIAANWKMYKTIEEAINFAKTIVYALKNIDDRDIVICASFPLLTCLYQIIKNTNIYLGAQNMYCEKEGPYTGEVSPYLLSLCGCKYVIIGHSERRRLFKEDDALINKKVKAALMFNLSPILCVGETKEERECNLTESIVENQIREDLHNIKTAEIRKVVIAYEPVWAIGTGLNATPQQAEQVHSFIRELLRKMYSKSVANDVRIQYGGSVTKDNIKDLLQEEDIDGVLVGGASLNEESFIKIVNFDK